MLLNRLRAAAPAIAATAAAATLAIHETTKNSSFGGASQLELKYFDGKGLAETSRLIMAMSGKPYTDTRWKMDMSKPYGKRCEGFMKAKADGDLLMNLDRAPLLLVDGTAIAQSKTIERYLARRVGLYGANEVEAAQIDAIGEHIRDMKEMHGKAADKAVFKSETLPAFLGKLEKVAGSTKGCLVGKSLSLADIQLYEVVCEYFPSREAYESTKDGGSASAGGLASGEAALLKDCPKLTASVVAVKAHPNIAKHVAGRNYTAPW